MLEESYAISTIVFRSPARARGTYTTLKKDLEQARNMLKMRVKFDVWSAGLDEGFRNDIRENLMDIFSQFPVQRVWYYLKQLRNMFLQGDSKEGDAIVNGLEDMIASGMSQVVRSEDIGRLMFAVVLNQISLAYHLDFNIYPKIISKDLFSSISQSMQIVFSSAGSICNCSISEIEQKAQLLRDKL
ncbi:hypothetical protein V498_03342 [Pseudogymnoascus sp. VKM F-4517 (FW-2822)]|nr:hypothetical protein V498_03342 [Pseudogymnoascus sp. VKM F-4517 (FW-2822)]